MKIQILREEASRLGMNAGELVDNLEKALNGEIVGQVIDNQNSIISICVLTMNPEPT